MYKQSGLIQFNIQPILNDIDNVIKNGLAKLLDEHLNRYELLEKTHKAIMNLPSVVNEVSSLPVPKTHNMAETILLSELNESFQGMCHKLTNKIDEFSDKLKGYDEKFDLLSDELLTVKNNMYLPSVVNEATQHNMDDTILTEFTESFQKACDLITGKMNDKFDLLTDELLALKNNIDELKNITHCSAQAHMEVETLFNYPCQCIKIEEDFSAAEAKEPENIILDMKEADNKTITFHIDEYEKEKEVVKVLKRNLIIESDEDEEINIKQGNVDIKIEVENNAEMKLDEIKQCVQVEEIEKRVQEEEKAHTQEHEPGESDNVKPDEGKEENKTNNEVEMKEEVETEKSESEEEEDEEDIFEIDIDDVTYCTNNETTGFIYELIDGEMGDKVGYFKDGDPFFYADKK